MKPEIQEGTLEAVYGLVMGSLNNALFSDRMCIGEEEIIEDITTDANIASNLGIIPNQGIKELNLADLVKLSLERGIKEKVFDKIVIYNPLRQQNVTSYHITLQGLAQVKELSRDYANTIFIDGQTKSKLSIF